MPYPFRFMLMFVGNSAERGTVQAFFCDKTIADKCCNELNATIGDGKILYAVDRIFPEE